MRYKFKSYRWSLKRIFSTESENSTDVHYGARWLAITSRCSRMFLHYNFHYVVNFPICFCFGISSELNRISFVRKFSSSKYTSAFGVETQSKLTKNGETLFCFDDSTRAFFNSIVVLICYFINKNNLSNFHTLHLFVSSFI